MGGCGRGAQGKAGAGEPRDAELDSTEGEGAGGYQPRRWSKTNSGTGAGESAQPFTVSAAWSQSGGAACWGCFGRAGRLAQMAQDRGHGRRLSQDGDDAHLRATRVSLFRADVCRAIGGGRCREPAEQSLDGVRVTRSAPSAARKRSCGGVKS